MLCGLFLVIRCRPFMERNALLLLFAGFYAILHLPSWAMVRYWLPVDAALIPLAVVDLLQRARVAIPQRVSQARHRFTAVAELVFC
jgi:hypothetical protein